MGTDTPLAVLSDKSQLLFNYFKQLFAQVTNPPIDPIREEMVTSRDHDDRRRAEPVRGDAGALPPARAEAPDPHQRRAGEDQAARHGRACARSRSRPCTASPTARPDCAARSSACAAALPRRSPTATTIIVLSDRGVDREHAPIPSLLATGAVHHHLIREGTRTRAGWWSSRASRARCMHFCLLVGYGAGAVNPYLAFETMAGMIDEGILKDVDEESAVENFIKAVGKSLIKVASKMGISTVQSYRGAQIFEAIGLNQRSDRPLLHLDRVARRRRRPRGDRARDRRSPSPGVRDRCPTSTIELEAGGQYQWRRRGEYHMYNPNTIAKLQHAVRAGNYKMFKEYTRLVDDHSRSLATLRGLLKFKFDRSPVPIEEVEPAAEIVKRFKTGAMSFGSIGKEAHENLAIAMNRIGGKSQHRRRRRRPGALRARCQWRLAAQRDQAGGLGALRRDQRVPGQCRRAADQDGAGRQARRGRPASRATRSTSSSRRFATRRRASD